MTSSKEFFEALLQNLTQLKASDFLDGYEIYEDYVKYGEAFIKADKPVPVQITPYVRRLTE